MSQVAALQVYAAAGYDPWLDILAQIGVAGIETLPRRWDEITSTVELRDTMSALRRAFKNDPQLGDKIRASLAAGNGPALESAQRRRIEVLTKLFEGEDNRYLNFYGPPGSIKTIPYNAVITGNDSTVDAADLDFSNKVVFVGLSDLYDPGQPDRFYTVFTRSDGVDLSGVEIAATAFGNLLTDRILTPSSAPMSIAILVLFGVIMGTGVYLLTAVIAVPLALLLAVFMNTYFGALGEALNQQMVDVTEFRADNIMCAWTSEQVDAIVCRHAALASLAVVDAVHRFNEQMGFKLYPRVGIAAGMIYVGHTGGGGRLGYSILGDCANTAARLENLNKKLGTNILASQAVVESSGDLELLTRPMGKFALAGKADPTPVVEILAAKTKAPQSRIELCERFAEAVHAANLQQWEKASDLFESILKDFPEDGPSYYYLTHCRSNQSQALLAEDTSVTVTNNK